MSAIRKRKVAKIQSKYVEQQESNQSQASKRKKLLIRRLVFFSLFAGIISYFMISTLISQASSLDKMQKEEERVHQELSDLKRTESILREEIVKLNDDEYIAKLARKDYFLSEKNEIIFNLPKEKKEKTTGGSND